MAKGSNPNRGKTEQSQHDKMVKIIAKHYYTNGYQVKADHIGWPDGSPAAINSHIPDVVAVFGSNTNSPDKKIIEVETCGTYADQHTKEQLKAFTKDHSATVYLFVPPECYIQAKQQVHKWGLQRVMVGYCNTMTGLVRV